MGKIKIKFTVIALVAMIMTFFTQGTLAYYTTVGRATNVVTSGNIQFFIHETTDWGLEFPKEGVYIVPGDIVSKRVTVESDCNHPFYLRTKVISGINAVGLPSAECFRLNINKDYWEYHDGWYYYKEAVQPGETTEFLFSHVIIDGATVDNRYLGKTLTLTVVAHAVQSENNPIEDGKIYTASGWPKE